MRSFILFQAMDRGLHFTKAVICPLSTFLDGTLEEGRFGSWIEKVQEVWFTP
jgi:hypothetical protein